MRKNAIFRVPVVVPVVVMLSAPCLVISMNAIITARRGGRVNRERGAVVISTNAIYHYLLSYPLL